MLPFMGESHRLEADERLAQVLSVLASPNRLTLLRQLREARAMTEIRLPPEEGSGMGSGGEDRAIARQAVRGHLRKLLDVGAASIVQAPADRSPRYLVNHQRLFEIAEEIRGLAQLRPVEEGPAMPTVADARRPVPHAVFPRLLLVRGLDEGRSFPLPAKLAPRDGWLIGRSPAAHVRLDYDPFVSGESALIRSDSDRYHVESLPQGRNGTSVNMRLIEPGRRRPLRHGDVVGVGRTLMIFHQTDPDA